MSEMVQDGILAKDMPSMAQVAFIDVLEHLAYLKDMSAVRRMEQDSKSGIRRIG